MNSRSRIFFHIDSIQRKILEECDSISRKKLAGVFKNNPSYLSHQIKVLTGKSFCSIRSEFRLQKAAELLETYPDISIKKVCYEVGYKNPAYFSSAFKARFSQSPSDYRDNCHYPQRLLKKRA
ncbi:MAG: helix-turn-helix transcriptional regulator [bacterium]|nr:helix-turn-helix transcriptional regulator [bacterium]